MIALTEILLTLVYISLFMLVIKKTRFFQIEGVSSRWMQGLFALKICAGFIVWLVYTYYYPYRNTSDSFKYFDDAMVILSSLPEHPSHFFNFLFGYNLDSPEMLLYYNQMKGWTSSYSYGIAHDNPTVIRLNVLIGLFSFGCYHVHTVFFSMMSYTGIIALFHAIKNQIAPRYRSFPLLLLTAMPSVLFWSSGVLKEAPLLLALGFMIWGLFQLAHKTLSLTKVLVWSVSLLVLFFIKGYVILAFLPAIFTVLACSFTPQKWKLATAALVHVVFFIAALHAHHFFVGGDLLHVLSKKQTDFYNVAELQSAGSTIEIPAIGNTVEFILNAPGALYRTYFRPDWRDLMGPFQIVGALESLLTLAFLVLIGIRQMSSKVAFEVKVFFISAAVGLGLIIGSVVPVVGAIVRYKIPGLLMITALLCVSVDWSWTDTFNRGRRRVLQD